MTPDTADSPKRTSRLLLDRSFGPYFLGKVISTCGMWVQNVTAAVLMYDLTASPFMVGVVSVSQFLGPLVLALWSGALGDRVDRRKLLIVGHSISCTATMILAFLIATRGIYGFGGPPVLIASVLIFGIGVSISVPAMQAFVPSLVRPEQLEPALALSSAAPSIGRAVGPAIGAALLLAGGPTLALGASVAGQLLLILILLVIRPYGTQQKPKVRPKLLGGFQYLLDDRRAGSMMLAVVALGLGADAVVTLGPSKADALGGGGDLVGLLASAFGLGAVMFLLIYGPLRRRMTLRNIATAGYISLAMGLVATGVSTTPGVAGGAMILAGTGFMMGTVALNTRIQTRVPDHLRGRVMALWVVAFAGSRPLAALVNGSIAELTSVAVAYVVGALAAIVALPLVRVSYRSQTENMPGEATESETL